MAPQVLLGSHFKTIRTRMNKKKTEADRAWWYFHAGFDQANQAIYKAVKGRMAASLGAEPTNLTIMVELMKFYLETNEE